MAAKLDHEAVRFHKHVITVAELESPYLSDSANVTVEVTDVNDNRPTYQNLTYHFEVSLYDYYTYILPVLTSSHVRFLCLLHKYMCFTCCISTNRYHRPVCAEVSQDTDNASLHLLV